LNSQQYIYILTKVISFFYGSIPAGCSNLISWKYSFEKISKDLELARKKKQALDDLFNSGKISASTYESLDKELTNAIQEIEARQKDLAEKITSKITELEKQINTLELFLASSEIQYAAGEIDEDLHANEIGAYTLGLDAVKQQLSFVKEVVAGLTPEVAAPTPPPTPSEIEKTEPTEEVVGETLETPVETTETLVETPVEEPTEAEPISEEVTLEEPLETQEEAAAEEATIEEPLEEAPSEEEVLEETAEETVATEEVDTETYTEETETEEEVETETSAEETSSPEETEEITEEEIYE